MFRQFVFGKRASYDACIVGGAGFIGSAICRALVSEGKKVIVLDNLSTGRKENVPSEAAFVPLDVSLASPGEIGKLLGSSRQVWHLAGETSVPRSSENREKAFSQNILGTFRILEAASLNGVSEIFFASSSAVYGHDSAKRPSEKFGPLSPASFYGATKVAGEALLASFCENFGIAGVSFRIANVVGRGQTNGILADLMRQEGDEVVVRGDGRQSKSYLHVSDCVNAMLLSRGFLSPGKSETYNISSKDRLSVSKVAELVRLARGASKVRYLGGETWKGDTREMVLSTKKIQGLGWVPGKSADAVKRALKEF